MKRLFQNRALVVVMVIVAVVLIASAALSIFSDGTSVAHKVANAIVSPFEKVFTSIKNGVASLWEAQTQYDELLAENEELRDEIRELEKLIGDAELYREENEELRALLDIRRSYVDLSIDTATIIAWNDTSWASTFTINKGTRDGVREQTCVITKDGLVGVVERVENSYAEVRTLIDTKFSTGVRLKRTNLFAVANGEFTLMKDGLLRVEMLPLDSDVKVGDQLVTSGVSDLFPPDIVIGTVTAVDTEDGGMTMYAEVAPAVVLDELTQVFVVLGYEADAAE
ncbi:MAG: rod shape-determining protein MreC [Clostridia bacterium]|nr:rod shape-determining protein MreC [Clostridia bacterium]